jgi:hypothetical protein
MEPKTQENPVDPATNPVTDPNTGNNEPLESQVPQVPSQEPQAQVPVEKKLTKRERLEFAKNKIEERLSELADEPDDNQPLTWGDLKKIKQQEVRDSAIELADNIENTDERAEVIAILQTRIVPSDNPAEDLRLARTMANAEKNSQILQDQARKANPGSHANSPANPGNTQDVFVPTDTEVVFMQAPYNLSKDDILSARRKAAENAANRK